MDHLADPCTLIFFVEDSPRLAAGVARRIEDPASRSLVSLASLWKIAIKSSLGKLQVDWGDRADLPEVLSKVGFEMISPGWHAMLRAANLPQHHRDPFDRLLVAEPQIRALPVLSCDPKLDAYGITRVWG